MGRGFVMLANKFMKWDFKRKNILSVHKLILFSITGTFWLICTPQRITLFNCEVFHTVESQRLLYPGLRVIQCYYRYYHTWGTLRPIYKIDQGLRRTRNIFYKLRNLHYSGRNQVFLALS